MGLENVVTAVEHVESLVADEETGPVQDSLSWQQTDADIQLGKACAMLGTCRQLRSGTNNYLSTARESRPSREGRVFRPQSEPRSEQGGRESRKLW